MPTDKLKPIGSYPWEYHEALRRLLGPLLEGEPGPTALSDPLYFGSQAATLNARRRWRSFYRAAQVAGRYTRALERFHIRGSLREGPPGCWSFTLHGEPRGERASAEELEIFLQSNDQ